jgi:UDP-N-acetylglucosamine 2-epimerase (non-hydrolysing)
MARRSGSRRRVVLFAGTRPEAIKLAPVALAAKGESDLEMVLVHSGQHRALFRDGLDPFGLEADHHLAPQVAGNAPEDWVTGIQLALTPLLTELAPALVVVQGDTSSALAGARAAHALGIPTAHVEAGLRSGNDRLPWPEEANRVAIAGLARYHFAPCVQAARNLEAEAVRGQVHVTGNPGIDALLHVRDRVSTRRASPGCEHLLVTAHRRETVGAPLGRIIAALREIVARRTGLAVTILCHPNRAGMQLRQALDGAAAFTLRDGLRYAEMVSLLAGADLVLSDSGGLQEECPALGTPLLVLRTNTERPEPIAEGSALLVGSDTRAIVAATCRILDDPAVRATMSVPRFPYGRGDAARRIVGLIAGLPI